MAPMEFRPPMPRSWVVPAWSAALAFALFLLPGLRPPWGPFIDELYYGSCADRPAWGYVDHPPLAPLVLRASRALLGRDGLLPLRLPVAVAGAAVVLGVGLLAARFGAGRRGQALACFAAATSPIHLIAFGSFSMNAFEIAAWFALGWLSIGAAARGGAGRWLVMGAVAGAALMFKHTSALYLAALAAGLLATPSRRVLGRGGPWLAAVVAGLLLAPNLEWQAANGWPSLEFYVNADRYKNVPTPPLEGLMLQVLAGGPGALPLWVAGLVFVLRSRRPERLDHLGWAALLLLVLMIASGKSRPDRIAGIYPLLFAAGGAAFDAWAQRRHAVVRRLAYAWIVGAALALVPLGSPVLPPASLAAYAARIGINPRIEAGEGKRAALPQWFADRLGWPEFAEDVARAAARLSPEERGRAPILVPSYGHAGAIEKYGPALGLGRPYTTQNTWFLWGPPPDPVDVAIVAGNDADGLGRLFEHVELVTTHVHAGIMPWRNHMPVWVVRRARVRIADLWPEWKHYE